MEDMERQRDCGVHDGVEADTFKVGSNAEKDGGVEGNEREEGGGSDAGKKTL